MHLVGQKPHIPGPGPIEMKTKNTENLIHLTSHSCKFSISFSLRRTQLVIPGSSGQHPVDDAFLVTFLFEGFQIIGFVSDNHFFISGEKMVKDLRVVDVGRETDKFDHKLVLGINSNMVFIAVDRLVFSYREGSIMVVFSRISCYPDQASINDFFRLKFKAFGGKLAFEFLKASPIEVNRLEVFTEAADSGVVWDRIGSGKAEEAVVEEVAMEHDFHFGVRVVVDLLDDEDFERGDRVIG